MFLMLPELEGSLPRTPPPFRGGKDRLCPTEQHGKIRGGCPCVQPGGSPGLPTGEDFSQWVNQLELSGGNSNIFYFQTYLGKWSNLTHIFQMGWNHQVGMVVAFQHCERNSGDVKMVESKRAWFSETVSVCWNSSLIYPYISLGKITWYHEIMQQIPKFVFRRKRCSHGFLSKQRDEHL